MKRKTEFDPRTSIVDVECPICGKGFVPAPYHIYKDSQHLYCSWTCFNHRKDKKKEKKNENN